MTSIPSTLLVVLIIITGQTLVRGKVFTYKEKLNEKCDDELFFHIDPGYRDGFNLKECNPTKFMKCKEDGGSYTCKCAFDVDPKDPKNKCLPPPPTQKYKELCSHLSRCYPPTQCKFAPANAIFVPDVCECPGNLPFYDTTLLTCRKLKHGEKGCKKNEECATGTCTNGVCSCPARTPNWNSLVKPNACQGKYFGEACSSTAECHSNGGLKCDGGKCVCVDAKNTWDDKLKKCDGKRHGEPCTDSGECADNFVCWGGKCSCAHTTIYDPSTDTCTGLPKHGEHCEKAASKGKNFPLCVHESMVCDDHEKCKCLYEKQVPDDAKLKCFTPILAGFGESCSPTKPCAFSSNLECREGKCVCAKDAVYSRGLCTKKTNVRDCIPTLEDDFCDDPTGVNEACDPDDNICVCPKNMEWAAWADACKLKTGENCYNQDQPVHDLCAGQRCMDGNDPTHPKKCGCGQGLIWSSEPGHGCIPNYFMRYCNENTGPEECHPKPPYKYNAAREGLICRMERDASGSDTAVTRCQCKDTLTFMQGYCIDASMSFGELGCNRQFGKTCKIAGLTSLSCMEFGNGTSICLCLPKVIPPQYGVPVRVPLNWDESLTKCELKKNSEPCKEGYECKSHRCGPNGLCVRRTRGGGRKKGGSPLTVAVNRGMTWLMTLVPLSLLTHQ